jgi:hypothetical protein
MASEKIGFISKHIDKISNPENGLNAEELIEIQKEYNSLKLRIQNEILRDDEKEVIEFFENILDEGIPAARSFEIQQEFMDFMTKLTNLNQLATESDIERSILENKILEMFDEFLNSYEKMSLKFGDEHVKNELSFNTVKDTFSLFGLKM